MARGDPELTGQFDRPTNAGAADLAALREAWRLLKRIEDTIATAGGYAYRQSNIVTDGFEPLQGYQYRCVDIGKDGVVITRDCTGTGTQKWAFPTSGAIVAYGELLRDPNCVAIDSTAVGAQLHVKPCDETNFQRFAYSR